MDLVVLLKAAILGLVEGATEFIPVSSTGHLILTQQWLGFTGEKENAFIIFIQLGAILAVVALYRRKLLTVATRWPSDRAARGLLVNLIIATIPAVVIGLPTEDWIEAHLFKPAPVALALALGGVAILLIERLHRPFTVASVDAIPVAKAFQVGLIQVLSIIFPGVSRSGATIMGGLAVGFSRTAATEFSFFLAVPAMLGAAIIKLAGVRGLIGWGDVPAFATGFAVSFVSAIIVVKALLAFVSRHSFVPFAWYRIALGGLVLALWSHGGS
ncbi:MAG TPA: undecaprenyl-diphosphate phosphatase [Gemmatimonadales bacterium]|nr:undecaprenyl-diphosphate phosphatase [Gemmatimonadales bacterium]